MFGRRSINANAARDGKEVPRELGVGARPIDLDPSQSRSTGMPPTRRWA